MSGGTPLLDDAASAPRGSQTGNLSPEKYRNPQTEDEILAAVSNDVTSSEWILAPMHRSWYEAILWTLGEHNLEWNQRTRRFQIRPVRLYVPRAVTNLILGRVERCVSMFKKSLPTVKYSPTSTGARDREAADNATGSIRYKDRCDRAESKKRDLANWVVVTGTGYIQAREDKANAERITRPVMTQVEQPVMGPDGPSIDPETGIPEIETQEIQATDPETGEPLTEEVVMADEGMEVCAPFEIVPDWNARYPWEWRRYTHVRSRTLDWIGREFGSEARKSIKPESPAGIIGTMGYYQLKVLDIQMRASLTGSYGLPYGYGGAIADMRYMEDSAVAMARYQLPNDEYKDGRLLIVAGGKVLYSGAYQHGDKLNLFTFRWSVLPGSNWGFGAVRNAISLQRRYNGINTQTDMIRKTMGNPWIFADRKSQTSFDTQTSEMGHIFTYKSRPGVASPVVVPAHSASPDTAFQVTQTRADLDDIFGTEDVLRGTNPTGVTAGVTIEHLTEQAGERFKPMIEENRDEFLRLYDMRIAIAQKSNLWQQPREVPMVGQNGRVASKPLSAADISGAFSAESEDASAATISHAVTRQNTLALIDKGGIDLSIERNRDRLRKMFGVQEFSEDVDLDRRRAEDDNDRMYSGESCHARAIDDPAVHIDVLTAEMKSDRFVHNTSSDIQALFFGLLKEYFVFVQKAEQAQMVKDAQASMVAGAVPNGEEIPGGAPPAEPPTVGEEAVQ